MFQTRRLPSSWNERQRRRHHASVSYGSMLIFESFHQFVIFRTLQEVIDRDMLGVRILRDGPFGECLLGNDDIRILCSCSHGSASSTVIPSIPGAPWLRLTCLYALFRLSLSRICSSRPAALSLSPHSRVPALRTPACSLRSTLSLCGQPFRYSAFIVPTLLPVCTRDLRLFGPSRKKKTFRYYGLC